MFNMTFCLIVHSKNSVLVYILFYKFTKDTLFTNLKIYFLSLKGKQIKIVLYILYGKTKKYEYFH